MNALERHIETWEGKSDAWLFERLNNELKSKLEEIHRLLKDSYTIEDIERAVNHWSMTTVEKENIIKFLEK